MVHKAQLKTEYADDQNGMPQGIDVKFNIPELIIRMSPLQHRLQSSNQSHRVDIGRSLINLTGQHREAILLLTVCSCISGTKH